MYEVSSGPAIAVPNLYGVPWKHAPSIANQAGLPLELIRSSTSQTVDVPTVTYQETYAGSLVPHGTTIEVIVTWPFTGGGGREVP